MFDSLAQCEKYTSVWKYLKQQAKITKLLFYTQPVQDIQVDSCALHVIYFTTMLLNNGFSFTQIMLTYSVENIITNDCRLIENFPAFLSCQKEQSLINNIMQHLPQTLLHCSSSYKEEV
jgi:hypothetical protein